MRDHIPFQTKNVRNHFLIFFFSLYFSAHSLNLKLLSFRLLFKDHRFKKNHSEVEQITIAQNAFLFLPNYTLAYNLTKGLFFFFGKVTKGLLERCLYPLPPLTVQDLEQDPPHSQGHWLLTSVAHSRSSYGKTRYPISELDIKFQPAL